MSAGFGHPCPSDPRAKAGADLQDHAHNPRVRKPVSFTVYLQLGSKIGTQSISTELNRMSSWEVEKGAYRSNSINPK